MHTHSRYIYNDPAGDALLWASLSAGTLITGHIPHGNPESYIYGVAIRDTGSDGAIPYLSNDGLVSSHLSCCYLGNQRR